MASTTLTEVAEDGDGQAAPAGEREADRQGAVDEAQEQACQWSHRRDAQIGVGRAGISLELGDATEQPEPDALDLDTVAASEDRVCHLVGEHRRQEQDGRGHRGGQVGDGASAGQDGGEAAGREAENQDRDDQDRTDVDLNPHASDSTKRQGRFQQVIIRPDVWNGTQPMSADTRLCLYPVESIGRGLAWTGQTGSTWPERRRREVLRAAICCYDRGYPWVAVRVRPARHHSPCTSCWY